MNLMEILKACQIEGFMQLFIKLEVVPGVIVMMFVTEDISLCYLAERVWVKERE